MLSVKSGFKLNPLLLRSNSPISNFIITADQKCKRRIGTGLTSTWRVSGKVFTSVHVCDVFFENFTFSLVYIDLIFFGSRLTLYRDAFSSSIQRLWWIRNWTICDPYFTEVEYALFVVSSYQPPKTDWKHLFLPSRSALRISTYLLINVSYHLIGLCIHKLIHSVSTLQHRKTKKNCIMHLLKLELGPSTTLQQRTCYSQ